MNVVITGASRGIGKAIADCFAAQGHDLYITSQNDISLYKAVEDLSLRYPSVTIRAKPFDMSDSARQFGEWVKAQGISPDVLVNNVGIFEPGGIIDAGDGALEKQMNTNLYSAYYLTRELLPAMMINERGHIFNICSIASLDAYKPGGGYSISKFALHGFSKNLRDECKPHGIKVTSVFPGAVMTESWGDFDNSTQRILEASDIAQMIYAASQLSIQACVEEILIRPQLGDLG